MNLLPEPLRGTLYVYGVLEIGPLNPLPSYGGEARGTAIVTVRGRARGGLSTIPVVRFGLADGGRRDPGWTQLVPWAGNGRIGYYGDHGRVNTRYTLRVSIDTALGLMDVHVRAEGEEVWFPLALGAAIESCVEEICGWGVEGPSPAPDPAQADASGGSSDGALPTSVVDHPRLAGAGGRLLEIHVAGTRWAEAERVQPYRFAKAVRSVEPGAGFRFQTQRSLWTDDDRHVTVARTEAHWLGFPDLVQTRSGKLICTYTEGVGHGGGPRILIQESLDLGRTWGEPREIGSGKCNTSRIQELRDGTLLHVYDVYPGTPVLQTSTDDGVSWTDRRELDPKKAGGLLAIVPGRVLELDDGSWLLPASTWVPPGNQERIEIYRSCDRGFNWRHHSAIDGYPPHSLSEPSLVALGDGRLVCYMREESTAGLPGARAFSADGGRSWSPVEDLQFAVIGRTCAGLLRDGRVLLTFRSGFGRPSLWACTGSPDEPTGPRISGGHYGDATSVGIKDGGLHIDNDGGRGQCTIYFLRPPHNRWAAVDLTAEVQVLANAGCAATIGVPYAGKLRILPDHLEMAHDPEVGFSLDASQFHTYRVLSAGGRLSVFVDGELKLETAHLAEKRPRRYYKLPWTRYETESPQFLVDPGRDNRLWLYDIYLCFGNEVDPEALMSPGSAAPFLLDRNKQVQLGEPTFFYTPQITPRTTGHSIWRRVDCVVKEPGGEEHRISWDVTRDGFPDQYQLDRIVEIEASNWGADQGYSGWIELSDGRILILNYTDDTALVNQPAGYWGRSWIRGTFVLPGELPG